MDEALPRHREFLGRLYEVLPEKSPGILSNVLADRHVAEEILPRINEARIKNHTNLTWAVIHKKPDGIALVFPFHVEMVLVPRQRKIEVIPVVDSSLEGKLVFLENLEKGDMVFVFCDNILYFFIDIVEEPLGEVSLDLSSPFFVIENTPGVLDILPKKITVEF
jgi:hypothetical protein